MEAIEKDTFDFTCPTRMIYRPNGVGLIGKIIKEDYHFSKVFLIYGGASLKKSGAYDKITSSLKENGIDFKEYSGIHANPDISDVLAILNVAKVYQPELILACGGGSVIDTAKSVANGYYYDGNPLDFNKRIIAPLHALPVATILTLVASGSEMSDSCVISDRAHHFKNGFNSITNRPLFSLLDPTLTYSVPPYQTAMGLIDMFSHSFERFFSASHPFEPCDNLALSILKSIVEVSSKVMAHPEDYDSRRAMMICGTLAHNGVTSYGKRFSFPIHQAEHRLSGAYPELTHGQGIALLMPVFLTLNKAKLTMKIQELGTAVFAVPKESDPEATIDALKAWLGSFPIYPSFEKLPFSVDPKDVEKAEQLLLIKA
ncbi:MAG: iron-containing alcohol dehydrogenase [Bacilli bacterium]|jgi:alcohol dehydrogenase YqhD (iron-dependent ADH family)|nr:iron-containing alcohol dehydrogenase [Bacilli bacterium]